MTANRDPILDLLPMVFAAPEEALPKAERVLDADPTPLQASVAHQVLGIWQRDFGDLRLALKHLRRARDLAARSDTPEREADVLATLGVALIHDGCTQQGLAALDQGVQCASGHVRARVLYRRAYVGWVLGRHTAALDDIRRAIPVLRQADDVIWTARALTLRATILLATGAVDRADADLAAAVALWDATGKPHDKADAVESRGLAAFRSGDIPGALRLLDEAEDHYARLGIPVFMLSIRRCEVLMAAGLAPEALAEADAAIATHDTRMQPTRKAELLLAAARAARLLNDPLTTMARATTAVELFARQSRPWWEAHARLVLTDAHFMAGHVTSRLAADVAAVADRLAGLGAPAAPDAFLLAARITLALGRNAEAERHLARAARSRNDASALTRMTGWTAQALRARAAGRHQAVLDACRRGLDALDDHRATQGARGFPRSAVSHGEELAALAQRMSALSGGPRRLLMWSERQRATAFFAPPIRPSADPLLQSALTAFREITARAVAARMEGRRVPALEREQQRLESKIAARVRELRAVTLGNGSRFTPDRLLAELGDTTCLVEFLVIDGRIHLLLCGQGQIRHVQAGPLAQAVSEVEHTQALLRRLMHPGAEGRLPLAKAAGQRLEQLLLGPAAQHLGNGHLVVVPPVQMHSVPWSLLPSLRDRVLSVAPSAGAWLGARQIEPPAGRRVVLVRGPGLAGVGVEGRRLAHQHQDAVVLESQREAGVQQVLEALDGAALAHITAHGQFRSDSPLFSSVRMADGPLLLHDLQRLSRSPYRIIFSHDSTARRSEADGLLALVAALLPLGTAGVVTTQGPVTDTAEAALPMALHKGLATGLSLAEALRDARAALATDAALTASGWAFTAFGGA
ncbi:CHAT domain-containing protein [Streptomyces sp. NPDC000134]|uniref:CHAT domain-containing protein n=1 Tax=Streptomyces sp. NPDC000134 TaxID=3364536 RepID=UPI0036CACFA2